MPVSSGGKVARKTMAPRNTSMGGDGRRSAASGGLRESRARAESIAAYSPRRCTSDSSIDSDSAFSSMSCRSMAESPSS